MVVIVYVLAHLGCLYVQDLKQYLIYFANLI